ncbi:hypothetical protein BH09BAC3_BH09BAC3_25430 [soil metagenome]
MDIFIKSFNRPYYLERCLHSIRRFVIGSYKITILDDGTPPEYMNKISTVFPDVLIKKSDQYESKIQAIKNHRPSERSIPAALWYNSIQQASTIFLLLEEDAWLTHPIDLQEVNMTMSQHNLAMVKISWNGAHSMVDGKSIARSQSIDEFIPVIPNVPLFLLKPFLYNTLKIKSILNRSGLVTINSLLPYYRLYTVTSAFFNKEYWIWLWSDTSNQVSEGHQLFRAVQWKKNKKARYGKSQQEKVQTSFITASENRLRKIQFDMQRLHYELNHAWLKGKLDSLQNYPMDFSRDYLKSFLSNEHPACTGIRWDRWVDEFKSIYRAVGCNVDN